jgi:hypothetical protein
VAPLEAQVCNTSRGTKLHFRHPNAPCCGVRVLRPVREIRSHCGRACAGRQPRILLSITSDKMTSRSGPVSFRVDYAVKSVDGKTVTIEVTRPEPKEILRTVGCNRSTRRQTRRCCLRRTIPGISAPTYPANRASSCPMPVGWRTIGKSAPTSPPRVTQDLR